MGDWGGIKDWNGHVKPAPNHKGKRNFAGGLDDRAQQLVAQVFNKKAAELTPRYVLNAGDNFYWAGLTGYCGNRMNDSVAAFF